MIGDVLAQRVVLVGVASFLESLGVPIPALPVLLLAGTYAAEYGSASSPLVIASACGFWAGDVLWYALGWHQGRRVLGILCALSLNPDACVGRAERRFRRRSALTVAAGKFVPGLSLMVAPLAGILRMSPVQFAVIDAASAAVWSATAVMAGVFYGQRVLPHVMRAQRAIGLLVVGALVGFVVWKVYERRWLVRRYAVDRVAPEELWKRLDAEPEDVLVIDLRNEDAFGRSAQMVPGARRIPPGEFERHIDSMPSDKEIILYCT